MKAKKRLKYLKRWLLTSCGSWLAKGFLRAVLLTCRIRFINGCDFKTLSQKGNCILFLWHQHIGLVYDFLWAHGSINCYSLVVSASHDGRLLSSWTATSPYARVIQVPKHDRPGALREMIKSLKRNEVLLVTPDGPRGPLHKLKPGALYAAQRSGATLIPFSYVASHYWQLKTWDRMIIPRPFSTITVGAGPSLTAPHESSSPQAVSSTYATALQDWEKRLSS